MTVLVGAIIVAGVGAFLGLSVTGVLKRRAPTASEGSRWSQLFIACVMLLGAALEVFIAVTGTQHPYVNIAVAALLAVTAIVVLLRNLRRTTPNSGDRQATG